MASDPELLREHVVPFTSMSDFSSALHRLDSFGKARILLIGDASHGTSEFYSSRASITQYMIENHGFDVVAVEADWPDAEAVDRYVRQRPGSKARIATVSKEKSTGREPAFTRFPMWMWRNTEVHDFVDWLRQRNAGTVENSGSGTAPVGFYGLDLYSLGTSMQAVIKYLDDVDKDMADVARRRYSRLMVWAEDPHEYGLEALSAGFSGCEHEVMDMLRDMLRKRLEYSAVYGNGDEFHSAEQNARLVTDAEHYYKAMYHGRDESWNLRDTHMFQTLVRILKHRGPKSKAIVWAHNSHVGDARATSMGWSGELNVGQLCKETFGDQALAIGCSTHSGTVAAADHWDGDMRVMDVRPGLPNSYEELFHAVGVENFVLDLREGQCDDQLWQALMKKRLERFIGVIYRPATERQSHYSSAILARQFDGLVWFDKSRHVGVLEVHQPHEAVEYDETWPFGM